MVDQSYIEFNYLVKTAKAVVTDSGGITKECTVMKVPYMTLRDSTERAETVTIGAVPEKWDGKTGAMIVSILEMKNRNIQQYINDKYTNC